MKNTPEKICSKKEQQLRTLGDCDAFLYRKEGWGEESRSEKSGNDLG